MSRLEEIKQRLESNEVNFSDKLKDDIKFLLKQVDIFQEAMQLRHKDALILKKKLSKAIEQRDKQINLGVRTLSDTHDDFIKRLNKEIDRIGG